MLALIWLTLWLLLILRVTMEMDIIERVENLLVLIIV